MKRNIVFLLINLVMINNVFAAPGTAPGAFTGKIKTIVMSIVPERSRYTAVVVLEGVTATNCPKLVLPDGTELDGTFVLPSKQLLQFGTIPLSVKPILAGLLAAKLNGTPVTIFVENFQDTNIGVASCVIDYAYF